METEESLTPLELRLMDLEDEKTVIPQNSVGKYETMYKNFLKYQEENDCKESFSEKVVLAYFHEKAKTLKPTTLWSQYSMLRPTMKNHENIDISSYKKVIAFLKSNAKGFQSTKSKVFTSTEVNKFLTEAPDEQYLSTKVILIFRVSGACRSNELVNMSIKDIESHGSIYLVKIPKTKTSVPRSFMITQEFSNFVKKYAALRPTNTLTQRFFLNYKNGKCSVQVTGINKIAKAPQIIAEYLNLEEPQLYTGHSCKRTSAILFADSTENITSLKRHRGWKSNSVVEGYIEDSITSKNETDKQIEPVVALPSTSCNSKDVSLPMNTKVTIDVNEINENILEPTFQQNHNSSQEMQIEAKEVTIRFTNCTNCQVIINKK